MTGKYRKLPEINFFHPAHAGTQANRPLILSLSKDILSTRKPILSLSKTNGATRQPQLNNRNPAETQARPGGKEGA